ncbi:virion structural protein [Pseudomonas phage Epa19]|nr:virion structural protein [Pseudomonas phage Epa19]
MGYQTGVASGVNDLLDKIRLFAIDQGWTVNRWSTHTYGRELCVQKGTAFFNMRSYEQGQSVLVNGSSSGTAANPKYGIVLTGSDGYSGGAAWDLQPGYPRRSADASQAAHAFLPLVTNFGPFPTYHLLAPDDKCIYLELEVTTGVFQRLGFGSLDLFNPAVAGGGRFFYSTRNDHVTNSTASNTWLGSDIDNGNFAGEEVPFRSAQFASTMNSASYVRCSFGAFDGWAGSARWPSYTQTSQCCQGGFTHDGLLAELGSNPLNGIAMLTPNVVSVQIGGEFLSPLGVVPGMRYMDMTKYLPGDEFTLGSDTWKVFPWYQKGGRSWQRGIAHKKVI